MAAKVKRLSPSRQQRGAGVSKEPQCPAPTCGGAISLICQPLCALPVPPPQKSHVICPLHHSKNRQKPDQSKKVRFGCFSLLRPPAQMGIPPISEGCGRSSGVEHNLAKVRVGRSNRLARSIRILSPNRTSKDRLRAVFLVFASRI